MLASHARLVRLAVVSILSGGYFFLVDGGVFNGHRAVDLAVEYSPAYFAMLWVAGDARRTRYWPAFHYGLWLVAAGLVLVPHYLYKTRGRAGLVPAVGFVLLLLLPNLGSWLGWHFYESLPDFRR